MNWVYRIGCLRKLQTNTVLFWCQFQILLLSFSSWLPKLYLPKCATNHILHCCAVAPPTHGGDEGHYSTRITLTSIDHDNDPVSFTQHQSPMLSSTRSAFLALLYLRRQKQSFKKKLSLEARRRHDRKIRRRAWHNPSLSTFTVLLGSKCDQSLITLTGFADRGFNFLLY